MTIAFVDTETYCAIPIRNGTYKYSEGVEVMIVTWAIDDGEVQLWDRTKNKKMPAQLRKALTNPLVTVVFHKADFDRTMIEKDLGIRIPPKRIHDTMAQAYSHGFPGSLDTLCDIFKVPVNKAKDKDGKKLIQLFCVPPPKHGPRQTRATRLTHPAEWAKFCNYARLDIEAMRVLFHQMPRWNYIGFEKILWNLDQKINERGLAIDTDLAAAAPAAIKREQGRLAARTDDLTLGLVQTTTKRDALLKHILGAYGVDLPDMQAATLERRIEDPELPIELKELLQIRLQASSTSTAKYAVFLRNVSSDGRLRGSLQFAGAARTKRWSGRGVQLHNMPRPSMKADDIEMGIEAIKAGTEDLMFDDVMDLARNAIRGCIVAGKGRKLVVSDLANIEGRVAAWIAGEEWKLKAFRAYDAGTGADLYKVSYAGAFRIKPEDVDGGKKSGPQRQIGKVMELMLQYQGGVGAFLTGAATYGIDLDEMAAKALPHIPDDILERARWWWKESVERQKTYDLKQDTFVACDSLKRLWRRTHPGISGIWEKLEDAARNAIESKNKMYKVGRLGFIRNGNYLRMVLPSGFCLVYASPRVNSQDKISYAGMNQYSRRWGRISTYGGKTFENATQAIARDVMAWQMPAAEKAGYPIITHTHDELVTEPLDKPAFTDEGLSAIFATNPDWSEGLPLAAGGFTSYRYKKGD